MLNPPGFFERRLELIAITLIIGLVFIAITLTQAGMDYQQGISFSLQQAEWLEIILLYSGGLIAINLLLSKLEPHADQHLFPLMGLLGGLSLVLIYRLPTPYWDETAQQWIYLTRQMWYVQRQALLLLGGQLLMLAVICWPKLIRWLRNHRNISIMLGLFLLLATATVGEPVVPGGPKVSLDLGLFHFQPSEVIKLLFVIYLAGYLNHVRWDVNRFTHRYLGIPLPVANYVVPMLIMLGSAIIFLIWMSDLGAALILLGIFPALMYVALRRRVFWTLMALAAIILILARFLLIQGPEPNNAQSPVESSSVVQTWERVTQRVAQGVSRLTVRVDNWRDPWAACTEENGCTSYQTLQSLYAVSAGGISGSGPGLGIPDNIPVVYADLILAPMAEEWGFLGATAILTIYLLLFRRGIYIAKSQRELFNGLLAIGLVTIFVLQVFVNVGGTFNLIPLTGITAPFLSYGGTSILINSIMVGLLLRLSLNSTGIHATGEISGNLNHLLQLYTISVVMLILALGYWSLWMGPTLHPSFPQNNAKSANPAAWQRQEAWLKRVERGQILAADGSVLVSNGPEGRTYRNLSLIHTLGQADERGLGLSGLEKTYNEALLGKGRWDLKTLWAQQFDGQWRGNHLKLTILPQWQQTAHDGLGAYKGAVVVLDAQSGAVLAMVSHPIYDPASLSDQPNELNSDQNAPLLNRATTGLYPPGSTFKTLVGVLAIQHDLVTPDTTFDFTNDEWYWEGERLCHRQWIGSGPISSCNTTLQQMTFSQGYAWSDNLLFSELAAQLGPPRLWEGAEAFGFGQPIPFDLPVEPSTLASTVERLSDPSQLAMSGFGQGQVIATPLQMALVAATVANEGNVPTPYLASEIVSPDGERLQTIQPGTWQRALPRQDANIMVEVMIESVQTGWANTAAVEGLEVGGKTGTAEWADTPVGAPPHSWFIGFATIPNGRTIAIAVIAEAAGDGSAVAAPIAGYILQNATAFSNSP